MLNFLLGRRPSTARVDDTVLCPERDVDDALQRACCPSAVTPGRAQTQMPNESIERVTDLLRLLDNLYARSDPETWSLRPRTYVVLRRIDGLAFMDQFVKSGFTDVYLPYSDQSLPTFLNDRALRDRFLDVQALVLTDARKLEIGNFHVHLGISGDQHFRHMHHLGQGGCGGVDEVWSHLSLRRYARKRVHRGRDSEATRRMQACLVQELGNLRSLNHRHLVKFLGSYTDKEYIAYLMLPIADTNLHAFLTTPRQVLPEDRVWMRHWYGCLAGALHYLHTKGIRHRDITSRNILIQRGKVFVGDFGASYKYSASQGSITHDRNVPHTPEYMAPEVARQQPRSSASDLWSLGIVFLEMTTVLLGRPLSEFKAYLERSAKSRAVEAYVSANIAVIPKWLDNLRMGNDGPEHDNEPLTWIRDLLQERHTNRPTSKHLMRDILESPSFHIFCCFECRPDFQDRAFVYDGNAAGHLDTVALEDSQKINERVAAMFEDTISRPLIDSAKIHSIHHWLADTPQQTSLPGSGPSNSESNTSPADGPKLFEGSRSSDHGIAGIWNTAFTTDSLKDLGDAARHTVIPGVRVRTQVNTLPFSRAKDTNLGFFEYESDSDGNENEIKAFNEIEDSSGTDSDVTVIPGLNQAVKDTRASVSGLNTIEEATNEAEVDVGSRLLHELDTLPEYEVPNDRLDAVVSSPVVDDPTESHIETVSTDLFIASTDPHIAFTEPHAASTVESSTVAPASSTDRPLLTTSTPANPKKWRKKKTVSFRQEAEHRIFQKPERERIPEISPSVYMQEAWESTSSRATSVMSANTRSVIASITSLGGRKFDRDNGLLELYCCRGQVAAVRCLLDLKCNPGTKTNRRPGPILRAVKGASERHNKCVRALIENGADVNVRDKRNGKSPLHLAIENPDFPGYGKLIRMLVDAGADTNHTELNKDCPLVKVFYGNDSGPLEKHRRDALAVLLLSPTNVNVEVPGTLNTPLHLAVRCKDPLAVSMLLHKDANVNAKNSSGITPLLLTAKQFRGPMTYDHATVLHLLLNRQDIELDVTGGALKQTALHSAILAGTFAAVEMLLNRGASTKVKDKNGYDAMAIAIQNVIGTPVDEHINMMNLLIQAGDKPWPHAGNRCTLLTGCKRTDTSLMEDLLASGLDPNTKQKGRPILQKAIAWGNMPVVKLLIQQGAFVDAENEDGEDAITYAKRRKSMEIAKHIEDEGNFEKQENKPKPDALKMRPMPGAFQTS